MNGSAAEATAALLGRLREGDDGALNCAENGVMAPLVGIIGTCQALEAIKLIADVGETLTGWVCCTSTPNAWTGAS